MMMNSTATATATVTTRAAATPPFVASVTPDPAAGAVAAARLLLPHLERGRRIDAATLRAAMAQAFGRSDADGAWDWKTAYDACEAATVLFLRKFGPAMRARNPAPAAMLPMLAKTASLLPTHTHCSEESQALQQFSTPLPLGLAASTAAAITHADRVLEPSAGTGLLAILAELAGGALVLNEFAAIRAGLLGQLFPGVAVSRFDATQIDDHLDAGVTPTVALMNPPFSAMAHVDRRVADTALRHIRSALARLTDGGRLVAITGASLAPDNPSWTNAFVRLQQHARIVFTATIDGAVYARHGTTTDTRLTVIDKRPADDPAIFPISLGLAPDATTLLSWVQDRVPPRLPMAGAINCSTAAPSICRPTAPKTARGFVPPSSRPVSAAESDAVELTYETVDWAQAEDGRITDALYEPYALQAIRIPHAQPHPTRLVQSAAMASVAPPKPTYRPHLPANLFPDGLLSDAQLESVVYAGQAHADHLVGSWTVDVTFDGAQFRSARSTNW